MNNGPDAAQNVRANNLFSVTSPSASGAGWSCTVNQLTIVCTMLSLATGPAEPLTIKATVANGSSAGDSASVAAATSDPNGNDNNASATANINPCGSIASTNASVIDMFVPAQ